MAACSSAGAVGNNAAGAGKAARAASRRRRACHNALKAVQVVCRCMGGARRKRSKGVRAQRAMPAQGKWRQVKCRMLLVSVATTHPPAPAFVVLHQTRVITSKSNSSRVAGAVGGRKRRRRRLRGALRGRQVVAGRRGAVVARCYVERRWR